MATEKPKAKTKARTKTEEPTPKKFLDLVTEWERGFDSFANQMMGTEAYSSWMNQMQKSQMSAQKSFGELMAQQLAAMNVPTREDVIRLGESVRQMDRRLERIEDAVNRLAPEAEKPAYGKTQSKKKKPTRTRKPNSQTSA